MPLRTRTLDQLDIVDEKSFRLVPHYPALKQALLDAGYRFRCLAGRSRGWWDRALFLNLTYWGGGDGDVLVGDAIDADVVTHAALHWLAARALVPEGKPPSADALFFGEAVASAYDVYLIGVLLERAPRSPFLESQVAAMAEAAQAAGTTERAFAALLASIGASPERAFEELRGLLFAAATQLVACDTPEAALAVLDRLARHRFACLLHHYELSTWVLYARAYASRRLGPVAAIRALDRRLAKSPASIELLLEAWAVA